jgi:hypothetical protein
MVLIHSLVSKAVNTETRKPWPMRWIIISMILFVLPYTYLTLHYRKPGYSYQPYQDAKEKTVLAHNGYTRISLPSAQPASGMLLPVQGIPASITPSLEGLTPELNKALGNAVTIPEGIDSVAAPAVFEHGKTYPFSYGCSITDSHHALAGARLYVKDKNVYFITDFEALVGGLSTRDTHTVIAIELPTASLEPGAYTFTVVGKKHSRRWPVLVK